jgi:hypothetical protein
MAAGDIACPRLNPGTSSCHHGATSDLLVAAQPDAVLTLGDNQYECGELANYQSYYDPTWGRMKAVTRPVPGNHDYKTTDPCVGYTPGAPGYYTYFGDAASPTEPGCTVNCKGYYSYDLGAWHIIALNSNCAIVSCSAGSPQEQWLRQDLAANDASCTLAYAHHPRFSSGNYRPGISAVRPLFQALDRKSVV